MKKRNLLKLIGGMLISAGFTGYGIFPALSAVDQEIKLNETVTRLVLKYCAGLETLREFGNQHLKSDPAAKSQAERLATALVDHNPQSQVEFRHFLDEKSKSDFAEEKMVIISGWALSETEATFMALIALCDPNVYSV